MAKALGDACASRAAAACPRRRARSRHEDLDDPDDRRARLRLRQPALGLARDRAGRRQRARDRATPGRSPAADALLIPGVGHFGACIRAICHDGMDRGSRDRRAGTAGLRRVRRHAGALRGERRGPGPGSRRAARGGSGDCRRGEGAAHGLEHATVDRRRTRTSAGSPTARASTSCTRSRPTSARTRGGHDRPRRHVRRRGRARQRVRHAVPPRRSPAMPGSRCTTGSSEVAPHDRDPGDRPAAGRAVRLVRGDPERETRYAGDPVEVAVRFQEEGARRLHVVDLDAALEEGENRERDRRRSARPCRCRCRWAAACGRSTTSTRCSSSAPRARSSAPRPRSTRGSSRRAVEEHAEAIVVAVDVRGGRVMVRGWQEEGPPLEDAVAALDDAGARDTWSTRSRATARSTARPRAVREAATLTETPADRERRRPRRRRRLGAARRWVRGRRHRQGAVRADAEALPGDRVTRDDARQTHHALPRRRCRSGREGRPVPELRDAGDPVELAARYDAEGADELVFLDITATVEGRASTST